MAFERAMPFGHGQTLRRVCWDVFITLLVAGSADCNLNLTVQSPPTVIAKAGSNVILNVSYAGAQNPVIQWSAGALPIVIWTVSSSPPDIAPNYSGIVSLMPNGSLVFSNVPRNYSATYTVTVTKTSFLPKTASITLQVLAQPVCSVQSTNTNLNYTCQTPGDTNSLLSFPYLNQTFSTNGSLSLVVPATDALNGMQILCTANQMNITQTCSVTARLGLSRAAILGLAIGIPCGFLLLLIIIALIILCVVCCRRRRRQPKYPAPSAKKVVTGQTSLNSTHNRLTRGIQNGSPVKNPKGIPEREFPLPSTGTLSPGRMATSL